MLIGPPASRASVHCELAPWSRDVPLTYRIDRERRRAVGSASGTVSAQEFLAQQAAMTGER